MRALRAAAAILAVLAAIYVLGAFFVDQLGSGASGADPAGVLFTAPPGFEVDEAGELSRRDAARRLADALSGEGSAVRSGIHFSSEGFDLYWLVDRTDPARPVLIERSAGPRGTRIETVFAGDLDRRLAYAAQTGRFDAPGLVSGESRNLYH